MYNYLLFRFLVRLIDKNFLLLFSALQRSVWTHIVMNYIGPDDDEGIRVYQKGVEMKPFDTQTSPSSNPVGAGRIVVGRSKTDTDNNYVSMQVDELIFFNHVLGMEEIEMSSNSG